jgi:flagellar biosynthesis component FlhA
MSGSPGWYTKEFLPMTVRQTLSVVALILFVLALVPLVPAFPFVAIGGMLLALANIINR